jgi:hypothetical protein
MGTIKGGSLTMRRSPSTTSVSFANARRLSLARRLARLRSIRPNGPGKVSSKSLTLKTSRRSGAS